MLSNSEEALIFLRDFEASSREYLKAKGIEENEVANAQLELQWQFLHTIMKQNSLRSRKHRHQNLVAKKQRATIA